MKRVAIVGREASGKSTVAVRLGEITRLPVVELDKIFWQPGLVATPRDHCGNDPRETCRGRGMNCVRRTKADLDNVEGPQVTIHDPVSGSSSGISSW
jgi:hypothetical protein